MYLSPSVNILISILFKKSRRGLLGVKSKYYTPLFLLHCFVLKKIYRLYYHNARLIFSFKSAFHQNLISGELF